MSDQAAGPDFPPISPQNGTDVTTVVTSISRFRRASPAAADRRYHPTALHARGGVGEVYRAKDEELDREVALKQLQASSAHDPEFRARFVREARITGRLQHPGIVPVYGLVHDAEGRPSYAMRFVDGESLTAAVKRAYDPAPTDEKPSTLRQLLTRFVAVCNAMAYAHSKGVVHRDLKPANVMLGPFGETYIVDWGLAKEIGTGGNEPPNGKANTIASNDATQHGLVIGTPAYMAPEQADGRWADVGPAADVYSLGATLYSILTGQSPFSGSIAEGVLDLVRGGRFGRPRLVRPDVPPALEAICLRAMACSPEDRYPSALDLAADVERWLADEPVQAYAERWPARLARWARRRRTLVGSSAAAGIVALVSLTIATALLSAANGREQAARQAAQLDRDDAARQRDRASENFRLARDSVGAILTNPGLKILRNIPQAEPARRKLLETALAFHEEFLRRAENDPTVREDAAIARFQIADLEAELGRKEEAVRQYEQAGVMLRSIDNTHPWHDHVNLALARLYNNLSIVQYDLGRLDAAEEALQQCVMLTQI
jgi:eukaryotic-like serine/threonine-protein kinase